MVRDQADRVAIGEIDISLVDHERAIDRLGDRPEPIGRQGGARRAVGIGDEGKPGLARANRDGSSDQSASKGTSTDLAPWISARVR